jgi:hypothetical protein
MIPLAGSRPRLLCGALIACLWLTGCATTRLELSPTPATPSPRRLAQIAATRVNTVVQLNPVVDQRPSADTLGDVAGRAFNVGQVNPWIDQALHDLVAARFTLRTANDPSTPAHTITPRLLKLYVDNVNITKTAVVVLQLDFTAADGTRTEEIYRGQYAGMNWASTEGEVSASLRSALDLCLKKITPTLLTHCLAPTAPQP